MKRVYASFRIQKGPVAIVNFGEYVRITKASATYTGPLLEAPSEVLQALTLYENGE